MSGLDVIAVVILVLIVVLGIAVFVFLGSWPGRVAVALLAGYKRWLSPLLPPACRFTPTCSVYASQAIAKYGLLKGGAKAVWRVLRCHPFSAGGVDEP